MARSSGVVAWLVMVASMVWGLLLATRLIRRAGLPPWLLDLHRWLGVLSIVVTAIHLGALAADSYGEFGWAETFVPFASKWRARAVAWGILAFYLMVAVQLTSWVMRWLPRRLWHAVHLTSFLALAAGTVHGALAGADRSNAFLQWAALAGVLVIVWFVFIRVLSPKSSVRRERAQEQNRHIGLSSRP
jgi:DMSO/TMAO reductase YedYZ heme-binding membrane subunit